MQLSLTNPVHQFSDEFPGWEDLHAHMSKADFGSESASTAEGSTFEDSTPSTPIAVTCAQFRLPPGLEVGMPSFSSQMPAYVSSSLVTEAMQVPPVPTESLHSESVVHAGPDPQAAVSQAVSAILMAQQSLSRQEGTDESKKMLADVVRLAIGKLQGQRDLAVTTHWEGQDLPRVCGETRPRRSRYGPAGLSQSAQPALSLDASLPLEPPKLPLLSNLRSDLKELRSKHPDCILVVRKIQKLGLSSLEKLREYFEWYGPVDTVFAPPVHTRGGPGPRLRPSHVGYVVFKSREAMHATLDEGREHIVMGFPILVEKFAGEHNSERLH